MTKSDDWDSKEHDLDGIASHGHRGRPPKKPSGPPPNYWTNPFYRAQRSAIQDVMRLNFFILLISGITWLFLELSNINQYIPLTVTVGASIGYAITFFAQVLLDRKWRNYQGGPLPI